jgi:hypothetical protein
VVYGLFHGLIFLPVVLSWVGRPPYASAKGAQSNVSTADVTQTELEAVQRNLCALTSNYEKPVHTHDASLLSHVMQIDGKRVVVGSAPVGFRELEYGSSSDE